MPLLQRVVSRSPEETQELGRSLGQAARAGEAFLLTGPLGAGKTCLTQGIAWGLGIEGYARSPTFVMITRYQGRRVLHHIDLFRIQGFEEALDLGLEEYLASEDVCVVEWANRATEVFPDESIWIDLAYGSGESERLITVRGSAEEHPHLVESLRKALPQRPRETEKN